MQQVRRLIKHTCRAAGSVTVSLMLLTETHQMLQISSVLSLQWKKSAGRGTVQHKAPAAL